MARVETLESKDPERTSVHAPARATYHVFEKDGETFLQIDTYGAAGRAHPEKVSQSLQLGQAARVELSKILRLIEGHG